MAPATPSDIPHPRRSKTISRANDPTSASCRARAGMSHASSMFETNVGTTTTSSEPSPTIWKAICTSPLSAYSVRGTSTRPSLAQCDDRIDPPGDGTPAATA